VDVKAAMTGMAWQHCVQVGQRIEEGKDILTMEIMKTEVPVLAPVAGVITWIIKPGENIKRGEVVARIEEE